LKLGVWLFEVLVVFGFMASGLSFVLPERTTVLWAWSARVEGGRVSFNDVTRLSDGIYVVGGASVGTQPTKWGFWKVDPETGESVLQKNGEEGELTRITTDGSRLYATGYLTGNQSSFKLLTLAFDPQGNVLWEKVWEESDMGLQRGTGLTCFGNYLYVVGYGTWQEKGTEAIVLKYDKAGDLVWAKAAGGGNDYVARGVAVFENKVYVVGSVTNNSSPQRNTDGYVLVMSQDGEQIDHFAWGGPGDDWFNDVVADDALYLVGQVTAESGDVQLVAVRMHVGHEVDWYKTFGGSWNTTAYSADIHNGRLHIVGKTWAFDNATYPVYLQLALNGTQVFNSVIPHLTDDPHSWFCGVHSEEGKTYLVATSFDRYLEPVRGSLVAYETLYNLTVCLPASDCWASVNGSKKTGSSVRFEVSGDNCTLEVDPKIENLWTTQTFSKWNDGNTNNPRVLEVAEDTVLTAIYSAEPNWVPIGAVGGSALVLLVAWYVLRVFLKPKTETRAKSARRGGSMTWKNNDSKSVAEQTTKAKPHAFICYSHQDASFVDELARDLSSKGVGIWLDKREIMVGDSITGRISEGIGQNDYLIIVLSKASVGSEWVQRELNAALMKELQKRSVVVLPLLLEDCQIPPLIADKKYADFRRDHSVGLAELLARFD